MNNTAKPLRLIAERYLDTRHGSEYIKELEDELMALGITGLKRIILEYSGLVPVMEHFLVGMGNP